MKKIKIYLKSIKIYICALLLNQKDLKILCDSLDIKDMMSLYEYLKESLEVIKSDSKNLIIEIDDIL